MNFRNEKYYTALLMQRINVSSFGNFHIVEVPRTRTSITITASYPRVQDLASVYMIYTKLRDGLGILDLWYRFRIERGASIVEINPTGWRITITRPSSQSTTYHLIIRRVYIGAYGVLLYRTLFDSRTTLNNICLIIKNYLK